MAAAVAAAVAQRKVDAVTAIAETFRLAVFPERIGLREHGREHLIPYGTTAFNAFGPRKNLRPDGWGAAVYAAADRGDCSHDEAERLVRSFLTAGVDTTVNGLANMLQAFATHPGEWAKLRADPSLAKKAFEESLRWGGTVQTFFRTTARDVAIGEDTIPEGAKVILYLAAANRGPRHWDHADRFDIARSASGQLGFGFGIHQCLGQMVARLEAEAVLKAMIERVAEIRVVAPAERRLNNTLHAVSKLPLELILM